MADGSSPETTTAPVQGNEFRLTWIATLIGAVGPAIAAFVATQYPKVPPDTPLIPVAVLAVTAVSIVAVALVYIGDITSRGSVTATQLQPNPAIKAQNPTMPVEAGEFRLTWIVTLIGVVGPALATFIAHQYPQVPPNVPTIPIAVLGVVAVSIVSVAAVYFFDVRSRGIVTNALRSSPTASSDGQLVTFAPQNAVKLKTDAHNSYRLIAMRCDAAGDGCRYLVAEDKCGDLQWVNQDAVVFCSP